MNDYNQISGLAQYTNVISSSTSKIIRKLNALGYDIPLSTSFSEISAYLDS